MYFYFTRTKKEQIEMFSIVVRVANANGPQFLHDKLKKIFVLISNWIVRNSKKIQFHFNYSHNVCIERLNFPRNHFLFLRKKNVWKSFFLLQFRTSITLAVIQHQRTVSLKIIEHFAKHHNNQKVSFRFSYWKFILQNYRLNVKVFFLHSLFP